MNFTSPYNTVDFFYTKEDALILFESPLDNTYFEMVVNITSYEFYTDEAKSTTLEYKIPLFNNKADFLLGEVVDRSMPRMKQINLRSLYQYKAAIVSLNIKEVDIDTESTISENNIGPIKFVSGFRPQTVENNCAFLEIYNLPRSVSALGYGFINMILPIGTHTFKVLKNKEEVDEFSIDIISGNIISRALRMYNYECKEGDIIECIMPANPSLNKSFYVLPDGLFTNYIAFEDEYRLKTIIEFTGNYSFPMEFETIINKVQNLSVIRNNKVSSTKSPTLTMNTGFLLEEEEVMIESLHDSKRAWLIYGENKAIELVPNSKKFTSMDGSREYYEYSIDFIMNLINKKPLRLALNQPLVILEVDDIPPTAPTNLSSSNTTTTATKLIWDVATDISGVAGYDVYKNDVYYKSTTANTLSVTGLNVATLYTFYVKARDLAGNVSESSNSLSVTTASEPDTTPPTIPTSLTASMITNNSLRLTWTASTDNVGILRYNIYRNGIKIGTSVTTTYDVSGLSPNTEYSFHVVAEDTFGNLSDPSSILTATTLNISLTDFLMTSTGNNSQAMVCTYEDDWPHRYHTGTSDYPFIGDKIYLDSSASEFLIGENKKFKMYNNDWIAVNNSGIVTLRGSC
ncbi:fibronectin type III domain-containing protein [Flavobacterium denitrificans]|uniref:fibronectin type III domain-containing protein n=1 Tax=Flavobacterium denitrificans TaxID=281361 RepID=UPI0004214C3E|nr:fibronectin type III domain-containing protein [Flavobacterium denitrificans]